MLYWDEENRLMVLKDNNGINRYTYNAAGERVMKVAGTMEGVYINGAPQGITFHETDNFTLYPASILSVNKNRFTKHYFIGDKRIASRIGTGLFNNVYGRNGSYVTAGQQDYAERMNQIQTQKEAYYKKVGVAPGVPTEKGAYGDPENTGVGYNAVLSELGNHDVPQGWIQTPHPNTTPGTNPGAPVSWNDPSNPDDPQAGYGYIPNDTTKEETFFYHSDHLGSTSYITDDKANITQYDAYLPYGELLVDEHSSSEDLPYKFNGKQFDEETGLYYYGARYMNPVTSNFFKVDRFVEKYPNNSPYIYCKSNPINFIEYNGDSTRVYTETNQQGHTWMSIGEGKNLTVYTYGRYNGTDKGRQGKHSSNRLANGDGVLVKLEGNAALLYNEEKRKDGMATFVIKDVKDKDVKLELDRRFNSSQRIPNIKGGDFYGNHSAHIIDKYDLLRNNCTTFVCDVLNTLGSKALAYEQIIPTSNFGTFTSFTTRNRIIIPASMQHYLNVQSRHKNSVVKRSSH